MTAAAHLIRGDARRLPLADGTVSEIITSPPYFGMRKYAVDGPGEIGSETHWRDWLAAVVECTAEMVRVLCPDGSIWVNLGDKYAGNTGNMLTHNGPAVTGRGLNEVLGRKPEHAERIPDAREKSLLGLPWRYALACVDELGLTLRAELIWHKPNGLPESVRDRVRRSHETWFHLVKQPRYYSAVDEIRTPQATIGERHGVDVGGRYNDAERRWSGMPRALNPLGKAPGSVWSVPSEPLIIPDAIKRTLNLPDHYASFGTEIPRRLILGWSPPAICTVCGQGRRPVTQRGDLIEQRGEPNGTDPTQRHGRDGRTLGKVYGASILGYACDCTPFTDHPGTGGNSGGTYRDAIDSGDGYPRTGYSTELHHRPKIGPWREYHLTGWTPPPCRPSVVLDPFAGTATTVGVARSLGRIGIGIDLSWDYCRLGKWRVNDSGHFGKALSRTNLERQVAMF